MRMVDAVMLRGRSSFRRTMRVQITVAYDSKYDLQGYVGLSNAGEIVVAFRGTDNLENWIENLKSAVMVPYAGCSGCEVADGFNDAWSRLSQQVVGAVQNLGGTDVPLVVTGHSLGAAMAALAAFQLKGMGYELSRPVYTFGQPRVGNPTYASAHDAAFSGMWWRVVHYADVVPHLPPELLGFHHVATEVWYNEPSTSYQVCNGSGEDPNCSDSLLLPDSISDHLDYINIMISELCSSSTDDQPSTNDNNGAASNDKSPTNDNNGAASNDKSPTNDNNGAASNDKPPTNDNNGAASNDKNNGSAMH